MSGQSEFEVGGLAFDAASGELRTRALSRRLEPKAAAVLARLCGSKGSVVSRQLLLDECWGEGTGSDEALTQAVAQIRRALEELGEAPDLVETLPRRGYRLRPTKSAPDERSMAAASGGMPSPPRRLWPVLLAAAGLVLIVGLIAFPHQLRHSVRHAFGLGPTQQHSQH